MLMQASNIYPYGKENPVYPKLAHQFWHHDFGNFFFPQTIPQMRRHSTKVIKNFGILSNIPGSQPYFANQCPICLVVNRCPSNTDQIEYLRLILFRNPKFSKCRQYRPKPMAPIPGRLPSPNNGIPAHRSNKKVNVIFFYGIRQSLRWSLERRNCRILVRTRQKNGGKINFIVRSR